MRILAYFLRYLFFFIDLIYLFVYYIFYFFVHFYLLYFINIPVYYVHHFYPPGYSEDYLYDLFLPIYGDRLATRNARSLIRDYFNVHGPLWEAADGDSERSYVFSQLKSHFDCFIEDVYSLISRFYHPAEDVFLYNSSLYKAITQLYISYILIRNYVISKLYV